MSRNKFGFILVIALVFMIGACNGANSQPGTDLGKAPDFTLEKVSGGEIVLSDELKERNVVLVFFATWCPHCVAEVPSVNKFYSEYKDTVSVAGINIQENKAKVSNFIKKRKVEYPIALDSDGTVAGRYNVRGIPAVFAIDKSGKIIYTGHSVEEMKAKIKWD